MLTHIIYGQLYTYTYEIWTIWRLPKTVLPLIIGGMAAIACFAKDSHGSCQSRRLLELGDSPSEVVPPGFHRDISMIQYPLVN